MVAPFKKLSAFTARTRGIRSKFLWASLLISTAAFSQPTPASPAATESPVGAYKGDVYTNEYFELSYPLSPDWVRATEMMRKKETAESSKGVHVLLAAVYVPQKETFSALSPFFTLLALKGGADCPKNLETMAAGMQGQKGTRMRGTAMPFSAGRRNYYRLDFEYPSEVDRHRSIICTPAKDYLLMWIVSAPDEKGVEKVISTLRTITAMPAPSTEPENGSQEQPQSSVAAPGAQKLKIDQAISGGLLVKRVNPIYPAYVRAAHIQGIVTLRAEITKTGDIADLEVEDGPVELLGSAVDAVRRWKYRPYLMNGEPVTVDTQVTVNYQLGP